MDKSLLLTHEIPHGFSWTLASRLGDMLVEAEKFFGPRNKDYTILGIEFCESGPRIWYPKSAKNIVIQLSDEAMDSELLALYQLAHECVHLILPTGNDQSTVLEEGMAVYFSWWYLENVFHHYGKEVTNDGFYFKAGELVERMMLEDQSIFLKLREAHGENWRVTPEEIAELCPVLSPREIKVLVMSFSAFSKQ